MKRLLAGMIFIAILLAGLSSFSSAKGNIYTVGVEDYENFLPYSQYKNEVYSGLGKDILDLFAKKKGYVFKYEAYPLKRLNALFFSGKLDFRFPDNFYWVADQKNGLDIKYAPMLKFTDGVLVLPKNKGKGVGSLKKMGMPLGFTPYEYLDLFKEGKITLLENSGYDGLYQQVLTGKIDGAYANTSVARYYWSKIKGGNDFPVVYDSDLPHTTDLYYISSIRHKDIIDEIKVFMEDDNNKAAIEELKRAHKFDKE